MKLPKYGVVAAVAIALMYVLYIAYCLVTGSELNSGEVAMGIVFVICVGAILAFEFKNKDKDADSTENKDE
jgi:hypothetical protein